MPKHSSAYSLLLQKAVEIQRPSLWCTDLTEHDKKRLWAVDAPQEFCWSVRETGTWLYTGDVGDLWRLLYWELRCLAGSRFFYYRAETLKELPFCKACTAVEKLEKSLTGSLDDGSTKDVSLLVLQREALQKGLFFFPQLSGSSLR